VALVFDCPGSGWSDAISVLAGGGTVDQFVQRWLAETREAPDGGAAPDA
jgi:hypothetical protein